MNDYDFKAGDVVEYELDHHTRIVQVHQVYKNRPTPLFTGVVVWTTEFDRPKEPVLEAVSFVTKVHARLVWEPNSRPTGTLH